MILGINKDKNNTLSSRHEPSAQGTYTLLNGVHLRSENMINVTFHRHEMDPIAMPPKRIFRTGKNRKYITNTDNLTKLRLVL